MWIKIFILFFICLPYVVTAQGLLTDSVKEEKLVHESTPRKTVQGILSSVSRISAEPLNTYFDTRKTAKLRNVNTQKIIDKFPYILDMHGSLTPNGLLSNNPLGSEQQAMPEDYEKVGNIEISGRNIPILLARVASKTGEYHWLVSQTTIVELSSIAEGFNESIINKFLPDVLQQYHFRGAPIGQWFSVLVLGGICAALGWLVMTGLRFLSQRARVHNETSRKSQVLDALALPFGIVIAIIVLVGLERYLGVSIIIRQDMSVITLSGLWIALFLFIWSLIENLSEQGEKILRRKNQVGGLSVIMFF